MSDKPKPPGRLSKAMVKKMLDRQRSSGYVLITCSEAGQDGTMEVELSYKGNMDLALFLLESAQGVLDGQA